MPYYLGSPKMQQFASITAEYLSGGKLYTYSPGTTTKMVSYRTPTDASAGENPNSNPIILDSRGETDVCFNSSAKVVLYDKDDNLIWSVDNISSSGFSGNDVVALTVVANTENQVTMTNAVSGSSPIVESSGTGANVSLNVTCKGSGTLALGDATGNLEIALTSSGSVSFKRDSTTAEDIVVSGNLTSASAVLTNTSAAATTMSGTATVTSVTASGNVSFLPTGCVMWCAVSTIPAGWLSCNGQLVSRTTYAALFEVINTVYGAGDGSTTFALPDTRRRAIMGKGGTAVSGPDNTLGATGGAETHTLLSAEMPAHTHTNSRIVYASGFTGSSGKANANSTFGSDTGTTGGGGAHANMQPSMVMTCLIRAR